MPACYPWIHLPGVLCDDQVCLLEALSADRVHVAPVLLLLAHGQGISSE